MMRSLYSGVSGLKTHQTKMDVIGNNIANVNTVAFKSSSVTFSDIMYQTTSGASGATETTGGVNAKQIGLGVSTGSTKVTVTSTGSAQSTGDALDIKLTDSNSTNFFIVNNGTENLFTRAGSFYLDGNGNLAMTSTGYLVQGWQTNDDQTAIVKDTVSPLRIMQASNLTSAPEATTYATASGVVDKNDTNITSSSGYVMSLSFYDNLGYAYTAKFSVKGYDTSDSDGDGTNSYTVKLTGIYDSDNNNVLQTYINSTVSGSTLTEDEVLATIFGLEGGSEATEYTVSSSYKYSSGIYSTSDGAYTLDASAGITTFTAGTDTITVDGTTYTEYGLTFTNPDDATDTTFVSLQKLYGLTSTQAAAIYSELASASGTSANVSVSGDSLRFISTAVNYELLFNSSDGTFSSINGDNTVDLNVNVLGDQFTSAINIDFTKVLNYDNGGSSTLGLDRGNVDNSSVGAGKKLGALTGISIQQNGEIYGSYDNGNTVLLGQIAVAQFTNASGLESIGNNCYTTTLNSGDFDGIGVDVTADGGSMNTGQLEMSNVDLSNEFTDMITTQRGFQANSRIITVSDTMLEELTNLKR
ncbi:MAG: flagellar hook-basal body complex protein [Lachnospiraceae bacterium]|nr:flagellar hook-basal body complex protein [Lachnospiraceae bacterium]